MEPNTESLALAATNVVLLRTASYIMGSASDFFTTIGINLDNDTINVLAEHKLSGHTLTYALRSFVALEGVTYRQGIQLTLPNGTLRFISTGEAFDVTDNIVRELFIEVNVRQCKDVSQFATEWKAYNEQFSYIV